jgi:hypothetical protein
MKISLVQLICAAIVVPTFGFYTGSSFTSRARGVSLQMVTTETPTIAQVDSPDFYWQFRLDRLIGKKGGDLNYSAANYPEASTPKGQYDAYYLDLTLQGKMEGFDWKSEKDVTDAEWLKIYKNICSWSKANYKANKPDNSNLPTNDFDLLKQFYPQLNMRDLETPFVADEVGENFPYANMGEMLSAAVNGKLNVPGYDAKSITSLDASEVSADLAKLKTDTMAKVDSIYADAMAFAQNSFPDDEAKAHYKELKTKLANFPQDAAGWSKFRADMEKEVDEMARLASKKVDHHHHDADCISPEAEFEAKYGKSLEEMQARMDKFKSDPEGFLEASIKEKFGVAGLDIWKKSQGFAKDAEVMSSSEKEAAEKAFSNFLGNV